MIDFYKPYANHLQKQDGKSPQTTPSTARGEGCGGEWWFMRHRTMKQYNIYFIKLDRGSVLYDKVLIFKCGIK